MFWSAHEIKYASLTSKNAISKPSLRNFERSNHMNSDITT